MRSLTHHRCPPRGAPDDRGGVVAGGGAGEGERLGRVRRAGPAQGRRGRVGEDVGHEQGVEAEELGGQGRVPALPGRDGLERGARGRAADGAADLQDVDAGRGDHGPRGDDEVDAGGRVPGGVGAVRRDGLGDVVGQVVDEDGPRHAGPFSRPWQCRPPVWGVRGAPVPGTGRRSARTGAVPSRLARMARVASRPPMSVVDEMLRTQGRPTVPRAVGPRLTSRGRGRKLRVFEPMFEHRVVGAPTRDEEEPWGPCSRPCAPSRAPPTRPAWPRPGPRSPAPSWPPACGPGWAARRRRRSRRPGRA